jgi:hypothetical protein
VPSEASNDVLVGSTGQGSNPGAAVCRVSHDFSTHSG